MLNPGIAVITTYALLAASLMTVWLPMPRRAPAAMPAVWMVCLALACASGLVTGLITWQAMAVLALFVGVAWQARQARSGIGKILLLVATAALTLGLAMHAFGGFARPELTPQMRIGQGATAVTLRLNFDTAFAGLILCAIAGLAARNRDDWRAVWRQLPMILGTPALVLAVGWAIGFVQPDPKLVALTPLFLVCNLLFTCITEEAFFRGLIQRQLTLGLARWTYGTPVAVLIGAALFGLAHARGGAMLVGLAFLAGLGNGWAYQRSGRIEAAILTHFALNALHFLLFTYPRAIGA